MKNYLLIGVVLVVGLIGITFARHIYHPVKPYCQSNIVTVTPVPVSAEIKHQVPTAKTQIDIPHVKPIAGEVATQHAVVTAEGNTVVVSTYSIDWGFKFRPAIVLGYDGTVYSGIAANVFKVWRFDLAAMASLQAYTMTVEGGLGLSFQVSSNTRIGVSYQLSNSGMRPGVFMSLEF